MLCAGVALLVLAASWTAVARLRAFLVLLATFVVVYLSVPGVLGTLTRLFTGASDDPSVTSRTGSYDLAFQFVSRSPVLGRGFGTFLPKYWILDNGYLGLLIEGGVVGLGGLVVVIAVAALAARQARRAASQNFDGALAQALLASVAAGAAGLAFFDTFGFPQSAGCFFLVIGLAGAARRLARASSQLRLLRRRPNLRLHCGSSRAGDDDGRTGGRCGCDVSQPRASPRFRRLTGTGATRRRLRADRRRQCLA